MWVKQCHLHHPTVITIFVGGIPKWVVYNCLTNIQCFFLKWETGMDLNVLSSNLGSNFFGGSVVAPMGPNKRSDTEPFCFVWGGIGFFLGRDSTDFSRKLIVDIFLVEQHIN